MKYTERHRNTKKHKENHNDKHDTQRQRNSMNTTNQTKPNQTRNAKPNMNTKKTRRLPCSSVLVFVSLRRALRSPLKGPSRVQSELCMISGDWTKTGHWKAAGQLFGFFYGKSYTHIWILKGGFRGRGEGAPPVIPLSDPDLCKYRIFHMNSPNKCPVAFQWPDKNRTYVKVKY